MKEQWRPVVGYEGYYEVSDRGRIKRVKAGQGARIGHILKPWLRRSQNGDYHYITLTRDGIQEKCAMHHIVYRSFVGAIHDGYVVHHKDHDTENNSPDNLEVMTSSEHAKLNVAEKRHARGEKNGHAKFTKEQIKQIRQNYSGEWGEVTALAEKYGVVPGEMSHILTGTRWAHVGGPLKTPRDRQKLSDEDVLEIRRRAEAGGPGWAVGCVRDFDISRGYVYQVKQGNYRNDVG